MEDESRVIIMDDIIVVKDTGSRGTRSLNVEETSSMRFLEKLIRGVLLPCVLYNYERFIYTTPPPVRVFVLIRSKGIDIFLSIQKYNWNRRTRK
jgi:hypothetical protein